MRVDRRFSARLAFLCAAYLSVYVAEGGGNDFPGLIQDGFVYPLAAIFFIVLLTLLYRLGESGRDGQFYDSILKWVTYGLAMFAGVLSKLGVVVFSIAIIVCLIRDYFFVKRNNGHGR